MKLTRFTLLGILPLLLSFDGCRSGGGSSAQDSTATDPGAPKIGDVVLVDDFSLNEGRKLWSAGAFASISSDGPNGAKCMMIKADRKRAKNMDESIARKATAECDALGRPIDAASNAFIILRGENSARYKGYAIDIELKVKSEDVPKPIAPWEGIRIVASYETPILSYGQAYNGLHGSFDWRRIKFRTRIPSDAIRADIIIGLLANSGSAWFADLRITVADTPLNAKAHEDSPKPRKGHKLDRLRGVEAALTDLNWHDIKSLSSEWDANVIKISVSPDSAGGANGARPDPSSLDTGFDGLIAQLDLMISEAEKNNIHVIIQLRLESWMDKANGGDCLCHEDAKYADKFVEIWKRLASRYAGRRIISGYELLDKPAQCLPAADGCPDYETLMERAAQAVNKCDPAATIIVQPLRWWGVRAFERLRPIKASNVVYAFNFQDPAAVTRQGVQEVLSLKKDWEQLPYPGAVDGIKWDATTLRKALRPALEFQKANNVHIIVSGFGCARWAPVFTARSWLADTIELFEEYEWDWIYRSYKSEDAWDVELGHDPWDLKKAATQTDRERLLKHWLGKNSHP